MSKSDELKKSEPKSNNIFRRKNFLVICAMIFVLLFFGVLSGWIYVKNQKPPAQTIAQKDAERLDVKNQTENNAQKITENGGMVNDAVAAYDKSIAAAANDPKLKNILIIDKSTLYFNNNNFDQALASAKEAEAINKDANIEQYIAQIYEKMGDKINAVKYYKNAIPLVDKTQPMADEDITYYQSKIDELSGSSK